MDNNKCEDCGNNDYRWDGQHLICRNCGLIFIREEIKAVHKPKKQKDTLYLYYKKIRSMDKFTNDCK